ncbi:blue light receptor [Gaertneriomyces sp. JEL0708]|nr:blue light receptor [Gaertneriomyces sp. JEL0708]
MAELKHPSLSLKRLSLEGTPPLQPVKPPSIGLSGIYSVTGFDLLGILSRVVHRPNPKINLGPVDMSCSFLVTDASKPEHPIVYASETFSKLTGYDNKEVVGKNCRFLQAPDGKVEKGSNRKYTDNSLVFQMKKKVDLCEECQFTVINYKKTGEPFINLVTIVPVEYYRPGEVSFFVGFQIDLVDQPQAMLERMKDNTYAAVNYQIVPSTRSDTPSSNATIFQEETYDLLAPAHSPTDAHPPFPAPLEDLIDDFGDFVHILSLRGLFLYAAPGSAKRILEYNAEELMGHSINEFIHPADAVSVMRELRTTQLGDAINIMCRFRRKHSGYVYMEVSGHVYEGDSKKRTKCFIMSGRERQICSIFVRDILLPDTDNTETWAKLSPQGLALYLCSNSNAIIGQAPEDVVAKPFVELLHDDDQESFRDALAEASSRNTVVNNRSRIIIKRAIAPVVLRFYPDACSPARAVYCQIKLVREGAVDPLDLKTLAEYEDLYECGNIFDVTHEARATSLHYELNQLRIHNKRLQTELDTFIVPNKKKARRRE